MTLRRLYAEMKLSDGRSVFAIVDDEPSALQAGIAGHASSFQVAEVEVATPEDNVDWIYNLTTALSEKRYLDIDALYTVDDVLEAFQARITALEDSGSPSDAGAREALEFTRDLYRKHRDAFNEVAFIREPRWFGSDADFHPLHSGEKAFNGAGVQIWPQAPAPA